MTTENAYFVDDACDWLKAHINPEAEEDAIAVALLKALEELWGLEGLEMFLDAEMSKG